MVSTFKWRCSCNCGYISNTESENNCGQMQRKYAAIEPILLDCHALMQLRCDIEVVAINSSFQGVVARAPKAPALLEPHALEVPLDVLAMCFASLSSMFRLAETVAKSLYSVT
ncbi:hypothetical protein P8452_16650 [Trifolium repens]|nr:hypothetical protein P8452_16650 [Trifolium repens]